MLRSTKEVSRLYLTDELRTDAVLAKPSRNRTTPRLLARDLDRFPPVEDVIILLDRAALRALVA